MGVGGISVGEEVGWGVEVGGIGVAVGVGGISVAVLQLTLRARNIKRQANNGFLIILIPPQCSSASRLFNISTITSSAASGQGGYFVIGIQEYSRACRNLGQRHGYTPSLQRLNAGSMAIS